MSPPTTKSEFDAAQISLNKEGLVEGEQFTWPDDELKHFLPEELHYNK